MEICYENDGTIILKPYHGVVDEWETVQTNSN